MAVIKNTLFVGKVLHSFDVLPSTNTHAQHLIAKSAPKEGTVITASFQSEGRGQIGSDWNSPPGENLLMSVIFYPTFLLPRQQFVLTQAAALAVRDLVQSYAKLPVQVKWPNDVFVENRKVAGILMQASISGPSLQSCVVGMGVNVNQLSFPPELERATSLALATGQQYVIDEIRDKLCVFLEQRYLQARAGQNKQIKAEYMDALLGYRKAALYRKPDGSTFTARIEGIDEGGKLLLLHDGKQEAFQLKEISLVRLL